MTSTSPVTLYHAPQTRSFGVLILLEELGVPYNLEIVDMRGGDNLKEDFLKVNPMGKVPAVVHNGALITEQVATYIYLADLYPEAGLAPATTDPMRGPFLRMLSFYGSSFEPAIIDKALEREPGPRGMVGYGTIEDVLKTLNMQLENNDYIAGDRFTAADVLWGTSLKWVTNFNLLEPTDAINAYLARIEGREAVKRATEKDQAYHAELPSTKAES